MKKIAAILTAILMLLTAAVLAEENAFTFRNGVAFQMDMTAVMGTESGYGEVDDEHALGGIRFMKVEYEDVTENGAEADLEYLFVENSLVAIRVKYEHGRVNYDTLMSGMTLQYGEAAAVDPAVLGNGIFAVDDDGFVKSDAAAFISDGLAVIVERERDDDGEEIEITYLDLTAAYLTTR